VHGRRFVQPMGQRESTNDLRQAEDSQEEGRRGTGSQDRSLSLGDARDEKDWDPKTMIDITESYGRNEPQPQRVASNDEA
jgi:hypothetical protein